jgi:CheY-specific phosphatase CheX
MVEEFANAVAGALATQLERIAVGIGVPGVGVGYPALASLSPTG